MPIPKDSAAEKRLVDRCLVGDELAVSQLIKAYQPFLLFVISKELWRRRHHTGDDEDIAARVWESLFEDNCGRLRAYDAVRTRLSHFLAARARQQVSTWLRHHRRDEKTQQLADFGLFIDPKAEVWPAGAVIDEFLARLSPQLLSYCHHLLGEVGDFVPDEHSDASIRVLKHRLLREWEKFCSEPRR
jgi:hypothetical protein